MKALKGAVLLLALSLFGASLIQGRTMALFTDAPPVGSNTLTTSAAFVRVAEGSFTKSTAAAPASQAITGVGFQPKPVIFFWTRQTAEGFAAMQSTGFGYATGSANQRAVAIAETDNSATSNSGRWKSSANMILMLSSGTPTLTAKAELTSFDADGFTINWTANEAQADIIYYIALGGDGLTNALASTFNLATGTGNQAVTGVGFQPDLVLFLSGFTGADDTALAGSELSLGLARSSTSRGAIVVGSRDGEPSNATKMSQQRTDSSILLLTTTMTQDAIADFVSMDTDGFTVNKSDAPAASTPIFYLALKGGQHLVGNLTQPAATGSQTITGVGFQPRSLLFLSRDAVAGTTIVAPNTLSVGAGISPTARGSIWSQALNIDKSDTNSYTTTSKVITLATSPTTVDAQADLTGFTSDGFTLNWSAADATARQVLYWALR